ncbi:MAG: glycerophosphodiester phosphodiesterase [Alphaproteobacteria bacterium]|nr:glycerophosphodiester phosphodiesterase [Alphaproteobacteria bacterium]
MPRPSPLRRLSRLVGLPVALTSVACVPHAPRPVDHLLPAGVTVIGHRGARALAPENTMAGFALAADSWGLPFELDVHLSSDGVPVVVHDETLDRTTDGVGFVDETPVATLRGLDAGSHFSAAFAGEPLPLLRDVLRRFGPAVVIDVELKNPRDPATVPTLAGAVVDELEAAGVVDRVLVTSFNPHLLAAVRARNPAIARGQLTGTFRGADLNPLEKLSLRHLWLNGKAVPDVLAVEADRLSRGYVRRMKRRGYRILAWTVNDPDEMRRLVEYGVDGLITDRPDIALQVVGQESP